MAPRITYRRQTSYNTRSNKIRKVKTPGGQVLAHYVNKKSKAPACGVCKKPLSGIPNLRPTKYKLLKKRERRVSRPYGGSLCGQCVRERVVRAFLIEEVKIVKRVMSQKKDK